MSKPLTIECSIHVDRRGHGARKVLEHGPPPLAAPTTRVPRVSKLMALALRLDKLVASGEVKDYAELARIGRVTRARVGQIVSLVYLAPDIQEALLLLPAVEQGRDPIILRDLLPIAAEPDWHRQRRHWRELATRRKGPEDHDSK